MILWWFYDDHNLYDDDKQLQGCYHKLIYIRAEYQENSSRHYPNVYPWRVFNLFVVDISIIVMMKMMNVHL